jgi:hypothetical protein
VLEIKRKLFYIDPGSKKDHSSSNNFPPVPVILFNSEILYFVVFLVLYFFVQDKDFVSAAFLVDCKRQG